MTFYTYVDWTLEAIPRPFYVGKGNDVRISHFRRNAKHSRIATKYGVRREIIFASSDERECLLNEIELIANHHTCCYDLLASEIACSFTVGGDGMSGHRHTVDSRQLMREKALKRKSPSSEIRLKMSLARKGIKLSSETRRKMSNSRTGTIVSEETKQKLSKLKKGKKLGPRSIEFKRKVSQSLMGIKRKPLNNEQRKNISLTAKRSWEKRRNNEKTKI